MLKYQAQLQSDSNLAGFTPDLGQYLNVHSVTDTAKLTSVLTSVDGVNRLIGSILSAPTRPPVVAVEALIFDALGAAAFGDESKKLIGRVVRQIVEHLGGRWVRRGVKTNVPSRFNRGSIYSF